MRYAEVAQRIALTTAGGCAGYSLARLSAGAEDSPLAAVVLMAGLGLGLWLGLVAGDALGRRSAPGAGPLLWSAGYALAGGILAGLVAAVLLALASTPTERASLTTAPSPSIGSVAPDMLASILAASIASGIAASSVGGAPGLNGRRGTLLVGGLLGGGFGGLLYELILYFLPRWERGWGELSLAESPGLLATAWLSATVGASVILAERLGAVLTLHRGEFSVALYAGESLLGSSPLCDATLIGPGVRPVHLRARWAGQAVTIEPVDGGDLAVNGESVDEATLLDGDELRLGASRFHVAYNRLRVRPQDVRRSSPARPAGGAEHEPEGVRFVIVEGPLLGETLEVPEGRSTLGSGSGVDLQLPGEKVSPVHATLTRIGLDVGIMAEETGPGLLVNGVRATEASLQSGDRLAIGEHLLLVVHSGLARTTRARGDEGPADT